MPGARRGAGAMDGACTSWTGRSCDPPDVQVLMPGALPIQGGTEAFSADVEPHDSANPGRPRQEQQSFVTAGARIGWNTHL